MSYPSSYRHRNLFSSASVKVIDGLAAPTIKVCRNKLHVKTVKVEYLHLLVFVSLFALFFIFLASFCFSFSSFSFFFLSSSAKHSELVSTRAEDLGYFLGNLEGGSGHFSNLESAEDFWGARRFSSTSPISELEDDSEGDIGLVKVSSCEEERCRCFEDGLKRGTKAKLLFLVIELSSESNFCSGSQILSLSTG